MSRIVRALLLGIFCLVSTTIFAQPTTQKFIKVPRDVMLPVVADQPLSPILIEQPESFLGIRGGGFTSCRLRNVSKKAIRRVTVGNTTGSEWSWWSDSGKVVLPGELVPEKKDDDIEIVPLTDEVARQKGLADGMKGLIVFMVLEVEFSDGTRFTDTDSYRRLTALFDRVDSLHVQTP